MTAGGSLKHILALDADGSLKAQEGLVKRLREHVDLTRHQDILRLYAARPGLKILRDTVVELRKTYTEPWLTFFGSGDFHHFAAIFLETLPQEFRPVNVVLIDNHPDWYEMPLKHHCATWVATALRLPFVESVTMVGQDSEDLRGKEFWFAPFADFCRGRVRLYPYRKDKVTVPLKWAGTVSGASHSRATLTGTELEFDTVAGRGVRYIARDICRRFGGKNVYLTIDKDALSTQYALTDWDQGQLSLTDLTYLIEEISRNCTLVGVDICGERAPEPLRGPWKRWDAGRLFAKPQSQEDWDWANAINQATNLTLLRALTKPVMEPSFALPTHSV